MTDQSVTVHNHDIGSAPGGDAVSNDYQVDIPLLASDTYSTTLEYISTTQ
jgi:hypothetical protein